MAVSTITYIIGLLGSSAGVSATILNADIFAPSAGPILLFISIAILWIGVMVESVEKDEQWA